MRKFRLAPRIAAALLFLVCCQGVREYDPYVTFTINHIAKDGDSWISASQEHKVMKGHTLEGKLASDIRNSLGLDGYAVVKYFTVSKGNKSFDPKSDYSDPDKMPPVAQFESQIMDLENKVFFEDAEVYAYYEKAVTAVQTYRVRCLDFSGVKGYGDKPKYALITVTLDKGDELLRSLLESKIRSAAGDKLSMDGNIAGYANYSGILREYSVADGDDFYSADLDDDDMWENGGNWSKILGSGDYGDSFASLGSVLPEKLTQSRSGEHDICVAYARSPLNGTHPLVLELRGLSHERVYEADENGVKGDLSAENLNPDVLWRIPLDTDALSDQSISNKLRDAIVGRMKNHGENETIGENESESQSASAIELEGDYEDSGAYDGWKRSVNGVTGFKYLYPFAVTVNGDETTEKPLLYVRIARSMNTVYDDIWNLSITVYRKNADDNSRPMTARGYYGATGELLWGTSMIVYDASSDLAVGKGYKGEYLASLLDADNAIISSRFDPWCLQDGQVHEIDVYAIYKLTDANPIPDDPAGI